MFLKDMYVFREKFIGTRGKLILPKNYLLRRHLLEANFSDDNSQNSTRDPSLLKIIPDANYFNK